MRVFVTGATAFIGRALIPRLQRDGHAVVTWVRSPARARGLLGAEVARPRVMNSSRKRPAAARISAAVVPAVGERRGGRRAAGARVVLLRTGVVLGRAGGALAQMLLPFQVGVGGPVGSGTQYLPWIHLHDLVKSSPWRWSTLGTGGR